MVSCETYNVRGSVICTARQEVYPMKKTIIILAAVILAATVLCACSDVNVVIDGVPADSTTASFGITYDGASGNAYSDHVDGNYDIGTEITACASPAEGFAFYCWSAGDTIDNGGTPVSYEKEYTFTLTEDTWLCANFRDHSSALVLYHANGGLSAGGEEEYWDEFSLVYYLYPNTLPSMGYFSRDGYTLIGYNTREDGTGTFYNMGGKAFEDTDGVIELWCVWVEDSPESDFEYEYDETAGGWYITDYKGKSAELCLPSVHQNQPVIGVRIGAFTENNTVETIVFPPSMSVLEDYSVNQCESLSTIYFFDSLSYISDKTFEGDGVLDHVFIGAATAPRYSNYFNNHSKKIELMNYYKDSERPKMIILGGSSTNYAVDPLLLENNIDRDYLVLNCGTNGGNLFNMTSEWAMRFLNEGDFLLHIIEYSYWQLGGVQCNWVTFRSFEGCYNVFSWVNMTKYTKFYDCFHEYLDARRDLNPQTYETYISNLADHGYYDIQGTLNIITKPNGSDTFWSGRRIYLGGGWPEYNWMLYYLNVQYWRLEQMGVDYAMAFTPLNRNSLYDYQTDEAMDAFESYLSDNLYVTVISDLQENIFEPSIFFDDDYHVSAPYREVYTLQLADDLNDYFAASDE